MFTIPAFNEADTLGTVISGIKNVAHDKEYEVLVVDDGSTDKTKEMALSKGATVVSHPVNYGLAEAFRTSMKKALSMGADVIVHFDADLQYKADDIPKVLQPILDGKADLVLGSRFAGYIEKMSLMKRWGNRAFSRVISRITRVTVTDAQTGFRAFTSSVAKLEIQSNHTYTQEQIIKAARSHFRIKEVPIHFAARKDKSRLISNPFEYALRAWVNLFRIHRDYTPIKFFGLFGSFFLVLGFGLGLWILYTLFMTGRVGGIPRTMLSALFITVGIQIWLFGFLADMIKK